MKQISGKEFCKIIEKKGWVLKRVHGSHFIDMKVGREERLTIPVHKSIPLKIGLVKALMKTAGLTDEDL